jgi:hypothetical protein
VTVAFFTIILGAWWEAVVHEAHGPTRTGIIEATLLSADAGVTERGGALQRSFAGLSKRFVSHLQAIAVGAVPKAFVARRTRGRAVGVAVLCAISVTGQRNTLTGGAHLVSPAIAAKGYV